MIKKIKTFLLYNQNIKFLKVWLTNFLDLVYPLVIKIWKLPNVKTIEETIIELKKNKSSIARFGDGEVIYLVNKLDLRYQEYDEKLASTLEIMLKNKTPNLLIGIPDGYRDVNQFDPDIKKYTRSQISFNWPKFQKFLDIKTQYWNANITRLYFGYKDQSKCGHYFELMRSLWIGKDILLIEGEKSRLGVGNDLFEKANSLRRILGPPHHAYRKIDEMVKTAVDNFGENTIVLVAMGTTAKAIVYELHKREIQTIDVGNIDLEYLWYKMGVKERVKIKGKYTSEVAGGIEVADVEDINYHNQIIATHVFEEYSGVV